MYRSRCIRSGYALGVTFFMAACATSTARNPFDGPPPGSRPVEAEVENGLTMDVGVYALQGASRFRIGTIPSLSRSTLDIPSSLLGGDGELRLLAEPIGSRERYVTQSLLVPAGSRIAWSIVPGLRTSQAWIRH